MPRPSPVRQTFPRCCRADYVSAALTVFHRSFENGEVVRIAQVLAALWLAKSRLSPAAQPPVDALGRTALPVLERNRWCHSHSGDRFAFRKKKEPASTGVAPSKRARIDEPGPGQIGAACDREPATRCRVTS